MEISAFAIVDVARHTGFTLSVRQTDPHPASEASSPEKKADTSSGKKAGTPSEETLIDDYLQHLSAVQPSLLDLEKQSVSHLYYVESNKSGGGRWTLHPRYWTA